MADVQEIHLVSIEVAILMEDKAINRRALALMCGMSEAELDHLLEANIRDVEIDRLRLVLTALKGAE